MTLVSLLAQLEDCSKMANSLPFAAIKSSLMPAGVEGLLVECSGGSVFHVQDRLLDLSVRQPVVDNNSQANKFVKYRRKQICRSDLYKPQGERAIFTPPKEVSEVEKAKLDIKDNPSKKKFMQG